MDEGFLPELGVSIGNKKATVTDITRSRWGIFLLTYVLISCTSYLLRPSFLCPKKDDPVRTTEVSHFRVVLVSLILATIATVSPSAARYTRV